MFFGIIKKYKYYEFSKNGEEKHLGDTQKLKGKGVFYEANQISFDFDL